MNLPNFHIEINKDLVWRLLLTFCAISIILSASDSAFANTQDDIIGQTLCRLTANLTGGIAKGIATIAIFAVGVGMFMGKLNWGTAAATAAGVGVIFGAPKLVSFISGDSANSNCPTG